MPILKQNGKIMKQHISKNNMAPKRCDWVSAEPIYRDYHDHEWGVPIFDDRLLFEFLILEGMQAGLSWLTILKKRDNFRACFDHFDVQKIAHYDQKKIDILLKNPGIIRNQLKIQSVITNAQAVLELQKHLSLSDYLWKFVDGKPIVNHWETKAAIPTRTGVSDALSKDLKKRGFKFVGTTICYAFMQAIGMVNDHTVDCFKCEANQR